MADRIKGITIELNGDATGLDNALKGVNKNISKTEAELKDVNRLLKLDPHNTELLAQKQRLLGKEIADTKQKLTTLKNASEQAKKALEMGKITQSQYDALQREIIETENNLKKLEGQARQTGNEMKNSGEKGKKGFNAKDFGEKAAKIGKAFLEMASAVGAALVALGKKFADLAKDVANHGNEVDKMSQKLGMSAEAYQKWDFVLSQADVDINSMQTGLKTLTNQIDDAKNGSSSAAERFAKLGISLEDLQSLTREQIFEKVIKGFQGLEDSTGRAALANDLFGKSGQNLTPLFNETTEATEELLQKAEEYGMIMSDDAVQASADFNDSLDLLDRTMSGIKNRIVSEFFPALTEMTDGLADVFKGDTTGGMQKVEKGISDFIAKLKEMTPQVLEIGKEIFSELGTILTENIGEFANIGVELVGSLAVAIVDSLPTLAASLGQIVDTLLNLLPDLVSAFMTAMPQVAEIIGQMGGQIAAELPTLISQIVSIIVDNYPLLVEGAMLFYQGMIDALPDIIESLSDEMPMLIGSIIKYIIMSVPLMMMATVQLFAAFIKQIPKTAIQAARMMPQVIRGIVNGIKGGYSQVINAGRDLVKGLWQGISNMAGWIYSKIRGFGAGVLNALKSFFKIGSPSKVMADEVGKWLAEGVGVGFVDEMNKVTDSMTSAMSIPDLKQETTMNASMVMPTSLTNMLGQYLPYLANQNQAIVLDTGVLVGQTAPMYNKAFGRMIRSGI